MIERIDDAARVRPERDFDEVIDPDEIVPCCLASPPGGYLADRRAGVDDR